MASLITNCHNKSITNYFQIDMKCARVLCILQSYEQENSTKEKCFSLTALSQGYFIFI